MSTTWWVLTATLPTAPSGLRVRVWRALRATGAGTLREGVYVLPEHAPAAATLRALERTIADAGAQAHLLVVQARDDEQEQTLRALFDRSERHGEFLRAVKRLRARIRQGSDAELRKSLRAIDAQWQTLQAADFFPGPAFEKSAEALAALRREIVRRLSPDEPLSSDAAIERLAVSDYQGRTWATRRRPWVDRLATAWLIQRFVDARARFVWLADARRCPKSALGYDFDGARFTHVGDKVTFEVVAESFGLLDDPALQHLARLVHCIDVGGVTVDEAPGVEMLVRGLQARHADDEALLTAALPLFDALHAAAEVPHEP